MTFRGILDKSLGGYLTFRGFAKLGDIENLSEPDPAYQRDLITTHQEEIKRFLTSGRNLFFPEVILGCKIAENDELDILNQFFEAYNQTQSNKFDFKKMKIELQTRVEFQSGEDIRSKGYFRAVILRFLQKHIELAKTNKPFKRIDGNHRISASNLDENIKKLNIPFCIVFFRNQEEEEKYSRVIFHNINYKSIPLSMEESLKLILENETLFPDNELQGENFGWEYYFTRKVKKEDFDKYFVNLNNLFNNNFRTTILKLFSLLLEYNIIDKNDNSVDIINKALSDINSKIYNDTILKNSNNSSIFSAFLFYQLKQPEILQFLKEWVIKNEIYKIQELEPKSIINIMENIANHKVKKIFVAMPYWSHEKVNEYNRLFKEALKEIEEEQLLPFKLELMPIMRHRGESQRIDQRLLNQIKECDIFIADLTEVNLNVLYEVAYAEGCGKKSLLIKNEDDTSNLPFDMDKRQYVPYKKDAYYSSIKSIIKNNLPKMLI